MTFKPNSLAIISRGNRGSSSIVDFTTASSGEDFVRPSRSSSSTEKYPIWKIRNYLEIVFTDDEIGLYVGCHSLIICIDCKFRRISVCIGVGISSDLSLAILRFLITI
ncbi:unnamed protein product [Ceratitis capitata]|uniref:(Mediterranean fruit fly) hypothetical protein n=1 Tax=Ceratitis capitata TaxID=7213 RepID=A0A811UA44_CERCA|nr:unnamed protein product [Ceratitis capitata]